MIYSPLTNGAMLHHLISISQKIEPKVILCSNFKGDAGCTNSKEVRFFKGQGIRKLIWFFNPFFSLKLLKIARENKIKKVLIVNGEFIVNNFFSFLLFKIFNIKTFTIWHDITPHKGSIKNYFFWVLCIPNILLSTKIITHSKRYHKWLSRFMPFKDVAYLEFPLYDFLISKTPNSQPDEKDYYLFIGRLEEYKGIDRFLALASNNPNLKFRIVGTGQNKILGSIKNSKLKNLSYRLEYVSDHDVTKEIFFSKGIILPYYHGSQSSLPYIAALLNKKIIASSEVNFDLDVIDLGGTIVNFKNDTLNENDLENFPCSFICEKSYNEKFITSSMEILK